MLASSMISKNNKVILVEQNEKLGKKLYITGKGRCNVTNDCAPREFLENVVTNAKFMQSAIYGFTSEDTMAFLEENGLSLVVERGNRVFPKSNKSSDVIKTLNNALLKNGVEVRLNTVVESVKKTGDTFFVGTSNGDIECDAVVVATGGVSYPLTGSTGDGYKFAKSLGHTVTPILPALVPFNVKEEWERELQGLSLKNVNVRILDGEKEVYSDFGEMLFTHFGVSGPTILSASSYTAGIIKQKNLTLSIDLKPALTYEQLDERVLRDFEENKNKSFKNSLDKLLPKKIIPVVIMLTRISEDKKVNEITKEERKKLVDTLKDFRMTLTGLRGFNEAIITQGGVNVKEINPSTMESKIVSNVFFAGEVLDVDAVTGGFNLQVAWSTGYAAGNN